MTHLCIKEKNMHEKLLVSQLVMNFAAFRGSNGAFMLPSKTYTYLKILTTKNVHVSTISFKFCYFLSKYPIYTINSPQIM